MRRALLGSLTVALLVLSAGCGGGGKPDSVDKPSPTATSSTPTTSPRDTAITDAKAALTNYYQLTEKLYANPRGSLSALQSVAIGRGLGTIASDIMEYTKNGWHVVGQPSHEVIGVGKVNLDNSAPARGVVPSVVLVTCTDPTKVKTLDKSGKAIPATPSRFKKRFVMANYTFATDPHRGWRVSNIQDVAGSC